MIKFFLGVTISIALVIFGGVFMGPYYRGLTIEIFIFYLLAQSVNMLYGYMGVLSFGQALFFGLGATIVALGSRYSNLSILLWIAVALICCLAVSIIYAYALNRLRGHNFVIFTVIFSQFPFYFSNSFSKVTGGDDGLTLDFPDNELISFNNIINDSLYFYYFAIIFIITLSALVFKIFNGNFGLISKGIRENELRMGLLGFNIERHKLFICIMSGFFAGTSGCLYVLYTKYLSSSYFHWTLSGEALIWSAVIAKGTVFGPLFGTAILLLLRDTLSSYTGVYPIIIGIILIISVYKPPKAILPSFFINFFQKFHTKSNFDISQTTNESVSILSCLSKNETTDNLLECSKLSIIFDGCIILNDISFSLSKNGLCATVIHEDDNLQETVNLSRLTPMTAKHLSIGLLGGNGAGKTTFLNVLSGIYTQFSGEISLLGKVFHSSKKITQTLSPTLGNELQVGRTFQRVEIFHGLTVQDNILIGLIAGVRGFGTDANVQKNIMVKLEAFIKLFNFEDLCYIKAQKLSFGRRKALELAIVVASNPMLLLLDEPLNGVGIKEKDYILEIISSLNTLYPIILVEHDINAIKNLCEYSITLSDGKLIGVNYVL